MAEVFLAKLEGIEGFERRLAIKRILPHYSKNDSFVRMFIDEARLVGHFSHPNIVQIFDFGKIDDSYYISMEYVEGINLADILTRYKAEGKSIPLEVILEVGIQACRGIDYAHKETDEEGKPLGIIHRDLTPHNILVSRKGVVKITDFGIAKASMNTHLTQAGMIKGKVPYMSPEQAMGMPLTHVSDIFAIGIVMYEMSTLRRLFEGENDFTILRKVQEAKIPSITEQNKSIPEELERIIFKALTRDRNDRYQWASEMEMELTRLKFSYGSLFQQFSLADFVRDFIAASPQHVKHAAPPPPPATPPKEAEVAESLSAIAADLGGIDNPLDQLVGEKASDNPFADANDKKTVMLKTGPDGSPVWPDPGSENLAPPTGPKPEEPTPVAEQRGASAPRRRYGLIGGIAAAAALILAAIAFLLIPRSGSLVVEVTPSDAEILLNGEKVGASSPFTRQDLQAGEELTVVVRKPGFKEFSRAVTIKAGVRSRLAVTLEPQYGFLVVNSRPSGAKVLVRGQDSGLTTPCKLNLAPGVPYDLTFQLEGRAPKQGVYTVSIGEEKAIQVDFDAPGAETPTGTAAPGGEGGAAPATAGTAPGTQGAAPVGTPGSRNTAALGRTNAG
jgi:serine/threonine protein kinase